MKLKTPSQIPYKIAIRFVILIGFVSFFADMTYEAARSISGQYLASLGASAFIVATVAGFGELVGYGFRLVSGYLSDKTKKYWAITFVGYILNLFAVPLLAFTDNVAVAAALMILERFGKAIRNPARDAMLSYAVKSTGRGFGFGLHQAMDRMGAFVGPLIVSFVLFKTGNYKTSFLVLFIPAILSMTTLIIARKLYPNPSDLEVATAHIETKGFPKKFWLYVAGTSCLAAGYVDFPLIAYHLLKTTTTQEVTIPILYAVSMGVAAISGLTLGRLYDKLGVVVLAIGAAISSLFAPLIFLDSSYFAILGIVLWGLGLGAQESIMPSFLADIIHVNKRGTAYGTLNTIFGISWFLGSALMGFLYTISIPYLVIFSLAIQLLSVPIILFLVVNKNRN
jgi:MFS family permease